MTGAWCRALARRARPRG
uniref:Uncharacterized protein n=1 Tax=Arundo donax TaxID=35708 RepID=A0A0A9F6H6_ARUDO